MTAPLWTLSDFLAATGGRAVGPVATPVTGISIDSRTIAPGEAYFAILGEVHDGHAFAGAALDKGAALAVVSEEKLAEVPAGGRYVVVDDVLAALRRLGVAARARTRARIVGVTGSVGKTSTKDALRLVLGDQGRCHGAVASFNNHWGVPLTLARMPADSDFGVFELGMNHAGEIADLVALVRPHVAVVTTVAAAHLEFFGTVAKVAEAKAEIFSGLQPGGTAVVNGDIAETPILTAAASAAGARLITFGETPGNDAQVIACTAHIDGTDVRACLAGREISYRIGAPGRHLVLNSLAVLEAAVALGADLDRAAESLSRLAQPKGRGSLVRLTVGDGSALLIDESYNANPTSMRAALALTQQAGANGRRLVVLGDMLELGADSAALHRGLLGAILQAGIDRVFLAGPMMEHLWQDVPPAIRGSYARAARDLEADLMAAVAAGDTIMIKGSLGSRMGPLVEALKARFAG